jgi:hypothetical protein
LHKKALFENAQAIASLLNNYIQKAGEILKKIKTSAKTGTISTICYGNLLLKAIVQTTNLQGEHKQVIGTK